MDSDSAGPAGSSLVPFVTSVGDNGLSILLENPQCRGVTVHGWKAGKPKPWPKRQPFG